MALLDAFKKGRKAKEKKIEKEIKPKEKPIEKTSTLRQESKKRTPKIGQTRLPSLGAKATGGRAYRILKAPHITEKTTDLGRKNQYVFRIWAKANKVEVKKAIEDLYKVKVIDVKIIKIPAKRRRFGRISGWKKGYKKAIVKVKEGQKIELFPK